MIILLYLILGIVTTAYIVLYAALKSPEPIRVWFKDWHAWREAGLCVLTWPVVLALCMSSALDEDEDLEDEL